MLSSVEAEGDVFIVSFEQPANKKIADILKDKENNDAKSCDLHFRKSIESPPWSRSITRIK